MEKKSLYSTVKLVVESGRPNTWLRIAGEMIIGATLASRTHFDFVTFALGFIIASPIVWTGGYMLNDLTDKHLDPDHIVRKNRPITSGKLSIQEAQKIITVLFIAGLIAGYFIGVQFFFTLLGLIVSQILYTVKPFRFKEKPGLDIAINSLNSALRFFLGVFTQPILFPVSYLPLLVLIPIKTVFFLGHRLQNKNLELRHHIKSTVTLVSKSFLYTLIVLLSTTSIIAFIMCITTGLFPTSSLLGPVLGASVIVGFLFKQKFIGNIITEEKNLNFRDWLYLSYFLATFGIAISLIFF